MKQSNDLEISPRSSIVASRESCRVVGSERRVECNSVHDNRRPRSFQGQPKSLILVPIENAYSISY